jgi:transposase
MMGRLKSDQGQLFYEFHLGDAVPEDHLVRKVDAALDLSWLRGELAPHYSSIGRPSIDPELMIRMLIVGYVFAIRSERLICREVQVNLAYRWFCKLGLEDAIPDHSAFSRSSNRSENLAANRSAVAGLRSARYEWMSRRSVRARKDRTTCTPPPTASPEFA